MMTLRLVTGLWLLAVWCAPLAGAQSFGEAEDRRSTSRAYFVHVLPGEPTITVSVWGTVPLPGTYEVSAGSTLGDVLSLAGGPLLPPLRQSTETEVTREIRVRVVRPDTPAPIFDDTIDGMMGAAASLPVLAQGDVVEVRTSEFETRQRTWRDTATIASIATSGLVALLQIVYIIVN